MRPVWTSLAIQDFVFMKQTRFLHLAPKFGLVAVKPTGIAAVGHFTIGTDPLI